MHESEEHTARTSQPWYEPWVSYVAGFVGLLIGLYFVYVPVRGLIVESSGVWFIVLPISASFALIIGTMSWMAITEAYDHDQ